MLKKKELKDDERHPLLEKLKTINFSILYLSLVAVTTVVADAISKELVRSISVFTVALMRGVVMVLAITPIMIVYSISLKESAPHWKLLSLRGAASALSVMARVGALYYTPLGDVSAIIAITPFLTAFWSKVILSEAITILEISFAVVSAIGICLLAQPPALFSHDLKDYSLIWGISLAVLSTIFASLGIVLNRKLSYCDIEISPLVQVFYYSVISTVLNAAGMGIIFSASYSIPQPSQLQWLLLVTIGLVSLLKQIFLTRALKEDKAVYVSTFIYSVSIVLSYLVQYIFFGDVPQFLSILGASLCIAATAGFVLCKYNTNE